MGRKKMEEGRGKQKKREERREKREITEGLDLGEFILLDSLYTGEDPFQAALR